MIPKVTAESVMGQDTQKLPYEATRTALAEPWPTSTGCSRAA